MAERFASVSEDELCEKCIITRVCVICLSLWLWQIAQTTVLIIHDNNNNNNNKIYLYRANSTMQFSNAPYNKRTIYNTV